MPTVIYPVLKCNYLERKRGDPYLFYCVCASYVILDLCKINQKDGNALFIPANLLKEDLQMCFVV